jgi:peptidoglycan/xylan/chitin deacetylase (PgdA/CDA1 family)
MNTQRLMPRLFLLLALLSITGRSVSSQSIEPTPLAPPVDEAFVPDGTLRRIQAPILMYHYISELPPEADDIRIDLTVSPAAFRQHVEHLRGNGYTAISLYDLHNALVSGAELPPRPVALTFDDGYIDHYVHVFPILREFGFTGTFFVITGRADRAHPDYMTWAQITEMAQAGMSMEAHTKDHYSLAERDYDFLVYQILGSIESLEAHTGRTVNMFAYPAGRYDETALRVMETMPIWRAVTTEHGSLHTTDNVLETPRVRVHGGMGGAGLAQLLSSIGF